MELILGTSLISSAVIVFCIVLIGFSQPRQPFWATDGWIGNVHSIVVVLLGFGGISTLFSAFFTFKAGGINGLHLVIAALILAATVIAVKGMKIRKRLDEFKRQNALTLVPPVKDAGPANNGHTPDKPEMAA